MVQQISAAMAAVFIIGGTMAKCRCLVKPAGGAWQT